MTPALTAAIDGLEALGREREDGMQVSRDIGELLAGFTLAHRAERIVEVGTNHGYSALWFAAALAPTGGRLDTIEIDAARRDSARSTFEAAGVAGSVTAHLGDASDVLPGIRGPLDLAFIDADKQPTQRYAGLIWPKLRVGGALLTDNVASHRKKMGGYLEGFRTRDDAHTVEIPIRAGLAYAVKLR